MSGQRGYKGKIALGQTTVLLSGSWTPSGSVITMLDGTSLTDEYNVKEFGRTDPGNIAVNGFYDPADTTGQDIIRAAHAAKTKVPTMRFYFGNGDADFFVAINDTTLLVSQISPAVVDKDDSGLVPFSFTVEVSTGLLVKAVAVLEVDTIAFVDSDPDTITDSGSAFITAGFTADMDLIVENSTLNDGRTYDIESLIAGTLTLDAADVLAAEAAGDDVALIGVPQ